MVEVLLITELTFAAAHYLPNHTKCGCIHGHTYFLRNLRIECKDFVDFGDIKANVMLYDHTFLIPHKHALAWRAIAQEYFGKLGIRSKFVEIDGSPTVENLKMAIKVTLKAINGVTRVSFDLFEGPIQGVECRAGDS